MTEKTYTLAEAKLEINREKCATQGHDYQIVLSVGLDGPSFVACQRCGRSWNCTEQTPASA